MWGVDSGVWHCSIRDLCHHQDLPQRHGWWCQDPFCRRGQFGQMGARLSRPRAAACSRRRQALPSRFMGHADRASPRGPHPQPRRQQLWSTPHQGASRQQSGGATGVQPDRVPSILCTEGPQSRVRKGRHYRASVLPAGKGPVLRRQDAQKSRRRDGQDRGAGDAPMAHPARHRRSAQEQQPATPSGKRRQLEV